MCGEERRAGLWFRCRRKAWIWDDLYLVVAALAFSPEELTEAVAASIAVRSRNSSHSSIQAIGGVGGSSSTLFLRPRQGHGLTVLCILLRFHFPPQGATNNFR